MLFLFLLVAAAIVAVLVWRVLGAEATERSARPTDGPDGPAARSPQPPRASGPDDDPEFLRRLDERVKGRDDEPPASGA